MAKVGYIFKADRYDGFEADKEFYFKLNHTLNENDMKGFLCPSFLSLIFIENQTIKCNVKNGL